MFQRTLIRGLPAAEISAANAARDAQLPAREQLNRLARSIAGLEAQGLPTNPEQVRRINALLTTIIQQDLAAAATAAAGGPTAPLANHIAEFNGLTAAGARRNAYYMDFVPWATLTNAIRTRDIPRIVDQVRTLGADWVSGEAALDAFSDSMFDE